LNTQKKPIKETITKDTTTKEGELERVIQVWNSKFEVPVNNKNTDLIEDIRRALNIFGEQQLIQAMQGRLESPYYRNNKPELLHKPTAFFPYQDTIKNDLCRLTKQQYTYEEHIELIDKTQLTGHDFNVVDVITNQGLEKRWELKKNKSGAL